MSKANEKFDFPYTISDLVESQLLIKIKPSYDKYFLCNTTEYLSRGEVLYYALKNLHLEATGKTNRIESRATSFHFDENEEQITRYVTYMKPCSLGIFLGQVIPIFSGNNPLTVQLEGDSFIENKFQENKDSQFEHITDWWIQIQPLNTIQTLMKSNGPVWVKLDPYRKST